MIRFSPFIIMLISTTIFAEALSDALIFLERNGLVAVETEHFYEQTKTQKRQWYITTPTETPDLKPDPDGNHANSASGQAYLEILPDTRRTHDDPLVQGENFTNTAGQMAIISYLIYFRTPGRYYVWVRAHSTGTEDNGCHVGLNDQWPSSGQRLQWCDGKNQWYWESKQRTNANHCGEPYKIYLDIDEPGVHKISFSMREDGFEMDKFLMTTKKNYRPSGAGIDEFLFTGIDSTAPAAPSLQHVDNVENRHLQLTWLPADEPDGEIARYFIFRNGHIVRTVSGNQTTFTDSLLDYETEYTYQVAAENAWGLMSESSQTIRATTLEDHDAPNLLSANLHANGQLLLSFDDVLHPETALNVANYDFSASAHATHATLSDDQKTVILDVASFSPGRRYYAMVSDLKDIHGNTMPDPQSVYFRNVESVWVSMHTVAHLRSGAEIVEKAGSLSGQALMLPDSRSYAYDSVNFPRSGTWYMWAHLFYKGQADDPNKLRIIVGSDTDVKVGGNDNYMNTWHWDGDAFYEYDKLRPVEVQIPASGEHRIQVRPAEPQDDPGSENIFLDGLYFTTTEEYHPRFSEVMTQINDRPSAPPEEYEFSVIAYPNPFNPSVTLQVNDSPDAVDIVIFDMLGRIVFEQENFTQKSLLWNAEHLPSGTFIVRIENSTETAYRKILLLK